MGRLPGFDQGLKRGAWSAQEDKTLADYIKAHGEGKWKNVPKRAGLKRCGKTCRLRWMNYLRPDIKRGNITPDEQDLIIRLHKLLGNRWSLIAGRLPGRTDSEIKNYWNTNLANSEECQNGKNDTSEAGQPQKYEDSLCNEQVSATSESDQAKPRIEDTEGRSSFLAATEDKLSDFSMNFDFETTLFPEFWDPEFVQLTDFKMFDLNNLTEQEASSGESQLVSIDEAAKQENGKATKQSCERETLWSGGDFWESSLSSESGSWDVFLDSTGEYVIWN